MEAVFAQVQGETLARTTGPWIVALDDSMTRKTGRTIPGCGWRRDPLSPPFQVNLQWGQRVLQLAAAIPAWDGSARLVPIDWCEAPLPRKPSGRAERAEQDAYREARKQANLNVVATQRIAGCASAPSGRFILSGTGASPIARSCTTCRPTRY